MRRGRRTRERESARHAKREGERSTVLCEHTPRPREAGGRATGGGEEEEEQRGGATTTRRETPTTEERGEETHRERGGRRVAVHACMCARARTVKRDRATERERETHEAERKWSASKSEDTQARENSTTERGQV
jgi:hypothetical protein